MRSSSRADRNGIAARPAVVATSAFCCMCACVRACRRGWREIADQCPRHFSFSFLVLTVCPLSRSLLSCALLAFCSGLPMMRVTSQVGPKRSPTHHCRSCCGGKGGIQREQRSNSGSVCTTHRACSLPFFACEHARRMAVEGPWQRARAADTLAQRRRRPRRRGRGAAGLPPISRPKLLARAAHST